MITRGKTKKLEDPVHAFEEDLNKFEIKVDPVKGRGVYTCQKFKNGEFLLPYRGVFLTEEPECMDDTYIFECKHRGQNFWIDATIEDGSLGRLINDSKKKPNCKAKVIEINGKPLVIFIAIQDVAVGEELLYNYGPGHYPWRGKIQQPSEHTVKPKHQMPESLVLSGFDAEEKSLLLSKMESSNIFPVYKKDFDSEVTHVIVKTDGNRTCERTLKYFQGIANHLWILDGKWILDSNEHNCLAPKENYEVTGDTATGINYGPQKSRVSTSALFQGLFIMLYGDDTELPSEAIKDLITCCGGCVVENPKDIQNLIIVNNNNNKSPHSDDTLEEYTKEYSVVVREWLLDSISVFKIQDLSTYLVTESDPNVTDVSDSLYEPETGESEEDTDTLMISGSDFEDSIVSEEYPALSKAVIKDSQVTDENKEQKNADRITVKYSTKKADGKKIWDKKHFCVYCEKAFAKLPRHLECKHKHELEIIKLRSLDRRVKEQHKERLKIIDTLRKKGDYLHNNKVLELGDGELVTKKSLSKIKSERDYLPCQYCLGFYLKPDLYRHVKLCNLAGELNKGTRHQSKSALLLPSSLGQSVNQDFQNSVIADMNVDEVSLCARNDRLITLFGERMYKQHRTLPHMYQHIRTKMRELARFLLTARDQCKEITSLADCLSPKRFQVVVDAVRILCRFDSNDTSADIPSLALKVGQSLSKCAGILLSQALAQGNIQLQTEAENFQKLHEIEWNVNVSATARRSLEMKKWNRPSMLPLTSDVVKLQNSIKEKMEESIREITHKNYSVWRALCETALASVILFNRRRSGEVEQLTLEVYGQKKKSDINIAEDISQSLNHMEKELISKLTRVEVRGKKGRKVPILFIQRIEEAVDTLISSREASGIAKENPFVFANNKLGHIRGTDCLRSLSEDAGLLQPENIRSTNLRKHIATLSQVINLKKNELDLLAQFLGHDVHVHRNFYRLPEDTLQLAKVGKLLMAANKGNVASFAGRCLDDINIDQEVSEESDSETEVQNEEELQNEEEQATSLSSTNDTLLQPVLQTAMKSRKRTSRKWTKDEKDAMKRTLGKFFVMGKIPGKAACEEAKKREPVLSRRTWEMMRQFVRNTIKLKK